MYLEKSPVTRLCVSGHGGRGGGTLETSQTDHVGYVCSEFLSEGAKYREENI